MSFWHWYYRVSMWILLACFGAILISALGLAAIELNERFKIGSRLSPEEALANSPAPSEWDEEFLNPVFDQLSEDRYQLKSCELGDEFYESVGLKFVSTNQAGEYPCSGWYTTEQGEVEVLIGFWGTAKTYNGSPKDSALAGWKEQRTDDGFCQLNHREGELGDVDIAVRASCEPLYPLARQLTNLAEQHRAVVQGDKEAWTAQELLDPNPQVASIAAPVYGQRVYDALPFGEPGQVSAADLVGATLTPSAVYLDDVTDRRGKEIQAVCVDTSFYYGELTASYNDIVLKPELALILPHDHEVPLSPLDLGPPTSEFSNGMSMFGEAHEVKEWTFCGEWPGGYRGADFVLTSTGIRPEFEDAENSWRFRVDLDGRPSAQV